nr:crustacyanin-C1 subunit-like isoform X1 [Penaeus vannamei]
MRGASLPCAVVLAGVIAAAEGLFGIPEFLELGGCANVTLMEDFDPVKYQGLWFDIASVPNEYQVTKQCISQNYTWTGDEMRVVSRGLAEDGLKVRQGMYMVPEEFEEPFEPAHMTVNYGRMPESPYDVISTDYTTYSCVYSCLEYFGFRAEFFWLFSRTPWISSWARETCQQDLEDMGIDTGKMLEVLQGETCPYNTRLDAILDENRKLMRKLMSAAPSNVTTSFRRNERVRPADEVITPRKTARVDTPQKDSQPETDRDMNMTLEDTTQPHRWHDTPRALFPDGDPEAEPEVTDAAATPTATRLVCLLALNVALLPVVAR